MLSVTFVSTAAFYFLDTEHVRLLKNLKLFLCAILNRDAVPVYLLFVRQTRSADLWGKWLEAMTAMIFQCRVAKSRQLSGSAAMALCLHQVMSLRLLKTAVRLKIFVPHGN